ncbi:MAG: hypothetical protein QOI10_1568 [Solirubrobacterales bacterium]|jgi:hypothetical protein|nr:hypothetical protein [Solirubrobacterales bacterium]
MRAAFTTALLVGLLGVALAASPGSSARETARAAGNPCQDAINKIDKAKAKLKKLRQNHAPAAAIQKAKRKVKKAKEAASDICDPPPVLYDITAIDAKFDATVNHDDDPACTYTTDAHWTGSLVPGPGPATLSLYRYDNQGHAIYAFNTPPGEVPVTVHGTGTATMTCSNPSPGPNGTATCTFDVTQVLGFGVGSDSDVSHDPMKLEWGYGFNSFSYGPRNGGTCSYSGARPPSISTSDYSPGLFVNPLNDGSNALEPYGLTTISAFGAAETLSYSGSASTAFGLQASWNISMTVQRR